MSQDVLLEVFYPHSPDRVWQALTDRSILSIWMMDNNFEARLGHQFQFQSRSLLGQKLIFYCEVLEIEAPKRLIYSWQESLMSKPSRVTWILNPVKGGTQVRLHHRSKVIASVFGSRMFAERANLTSIDLSLIPLSPAMNLSKPISRIKNDSHQISELFNLQTNWHYWLEQRLTKVLTQLQL